jgi:hypothetical protein
VQGRSHVIFFWKTSGKLSSRWNHQIKVYIHGYIKPTTTTEVVMFPDFSMAKPGFYYPYNVHALTGIVK